MRKLDMTTLERQEHDRRLSRAAYARYKQKHGKDHIRKLRSGWDHNNKERSVLTKIKARAKATNIEFDLEVEDIVIPNICPILQIPINKNASKMSPDSVSVDRVDNNRGYIKGNVRVISMSANRKKNDLTLYEAEQLVAYMRGEL